MTQIFALASLSHFRLKILSLCLVTFSLGCQVSYVLKNAYYQVKLINEQVDFDKALLNEKLTPDEKRKILLAKEAKDFAEQHVGLKKSRNYTGFVYLDQPYVSYVVSAAEKWQLKQYVWSYPIVGQMPYRGYFRENAAKESATEYEQQGFDVYMRGVSAYSTLGWFRDPLVSSMLRYADVHLVDTIIHETVHTTLYIKNNADFNERLAVFIGTKATEQFYLKKEGEHSETLAQLRLESEDERLFSEFISLELKNLEEWYKNLAENQKTEFIREERFKLIQQKFHTEVLPKMKTKNYSKFHELKLNNARLLIYRTYVQDLNDFEALFTKLAGDWPKFLAACFELEKSHDPVIALKELIASAK